MKEIGYSQVDDCLIPGIKGNVLLPQLNRFGRMLLK